MVTQKEIEKRQAERTSRARKTDVKKQAKKVAKTDKEKKQWVKRPNRSDIEGVDTPTKKSTIKKETLKELFNDFEKKVKITNIAVSGETYPIRGVLTGLGYTWNGKVWIKKHKKGTFYTEYKAVEKYLQYQRVTFDFYAAKSKENYFAEKEFHKKHGKRVILWISD